MPGLPAVLPLAAALAMGFAWVLFRAQASQQSHRLLAAALVPVSMLLPNLLLALGLITLRSATGVGLVVLAAAVVEAALVSRGGLEKYPPTSRRAWAALWIAVAGVHLLLLLQGVWPYLPQLSLFAALGVLSWIRVDRALVERGVAVVWTAFAGLMLALLPFGVLDGTAAQEPIEALSQESPYWSPVLSAFGLDTRWAGMFPHPNALGAFAAMGVGIALSGSRVAWPLLGLSTPLLLLSLSRTAGLAALVGALAYAVIKGRQRARTGVMLVAALVGWITLQSLARDSNVATGTGRFEVWASVPNLLGSDWLWGLGGPAGGESLVQSGLLPAWAARLHSVLFEHLLYSGVLGLALVVVLMLLLFATAARNKSGLPLFLTVLVLALGDNYANLFQLTLGVLGYVAVIGVCTPPLAVVRRRSDDPRQAESGRQGYALPLRGPSSR